MRMKLLIILALGLLIQGCSGGVKTRLILQVGTERSTFLDPSTPEMP